MLILSFLIPSTTFLVRLNIESLSGFTDLVVSITKVRGGFNTLINYYVHSSIFPRIPYPGLDQVHLPPIVDKTCTGNWQGIFLLTDRRSLDCWLPDHKHSQEQEEAYIDSPKDNSEWRGDRSQGVGEVQVILTRVWQSCTMMKPQHMAWSRPIIFTRLHCQFTACTSPTLFVSVEGIVSLWTVSLTRYYTAT